MDAQPARFPERLLVAIGGNATHPQDIRGTTEEQLKVAADAALALMPLMTACKQLVVTHGNGPVVGKILLRQFHARQLVAPMRLDVCVADSQGGIGYLLTQAMENVLARAGNPRLVACVLTEVEVDRDDPAFSAPSKPIGPFFSADDARALAGTGWQMMQDCGRGWRLAVPSPEPKSIVNFPIIQTLAGEGWIVVAAGGGGIPVVRAADGSRSGIQAVVDKDLTSGLLARALGIEHLLILTSVSRVAIRFRKPAERWLDQVTAAEMRHYQAEGHFGKGSMEPKVEAAIRFLQAGGKRVVIAHLDEAVAALRGDTGTHIVPD
ncbi:MAG: carbamate kinase [Burkholderiales bacterium]|nr:carbamate kinase [Burkholderiales bacterium]